MRGRYPQNGLSRTTPAPPLLANEELTQRGYYTTDGLRGDPFGIYESFQIGATSLAALGKAGLQGDLPSGLTFPFRAYPPGGRA